jgi:hypothetical protein
MNYRNSNNQAAKNDLKTNQMSIYSSNTSNYDNNSNISQNQESDIIPDLNDSFNSVKKGAPLYIICEKAQLRVRTNLLSSEIRD